MFIEANRFIEAKSILARSNRVFWHTHTHMRPNQSPKIAKWDREERVFIEAKSVPRNNLYTTCLEDEVFIEANS